jgi:segregation and condensation protein B
MGLKAKIEAIIYAAEEPITLEQISLLVRDIALAEEAAVKTGADAIVEGGLVVHAASPEANGAPASDANEPTEPVTVDDASNGGAVSQPDGFAEEAAAEVGDISEAEATPAEVAIQAEPEPQASLTAPSQSAGKHLAPATAGAALAAGARKPANPEDARIRLRVRSVVEELITDYASEDRGMEIRQVAGGFRMATKPQHHDVVRAFARSLKPPVRLSIAALETLAVIAYKQPVTAPEISEIRGVESAGVLGTLLDRKLITTAGRKQVIGRPILYKTTKQFLLRFGLNELSELPSMEEFEKLALDGQVELFTPSPETRAPEEAGAEESPSEETSAEASAEPPAPSNPAANEQPSPTQTGEKTESRGAPVNGAEDDK